MTCTNCALGIEKYLSKQGMEKVQVDFSSGEVDFELIEPKQLPSLVKGIERLGFEVVQEEGAPAGNMSKIEVYFYLSLIFTLPLIAHMFISWAWLHQPLVQLALAAPVFLLGLWHFGRSAWNSLKSGVPNMDVLITLGASAAFGYSLYGTVLQLGPDFLFYETAASIITLVLLGNLLEHRAVQKTTTAFKALSQLRPEKARRIILLNDGEEQISTVPFSDLQRGDLLQVNSGDRIPADGQVVQGSGETDESMISGESLPQTKSIGDALISGTLLVNGTLRMRATQVGKASTVSQIIELVKQAQAEKPEIQQLADRISAVFVPIVVGIALLTFVLSYFAFGLSLSSAIIHSVAVLVIACPCAMGLATPTAVVVGIGNASRKGILIKGGRTLEQIAQVKQVVFDKTGTLTTGEFRLHAIHGDPDQLDQIKGIILALEQHSSHPIARSLRKALSSSTPLALREVSESKGIGLLGKDEMGNTYQLGSNRLVANLEVYPGHSLYLLKNGAYWASIDLEDQIRPGAEAVIQYLKEQQIKPIMLSGDQLARCQLVADRLGIESVFGEQLPEEKLKQIEVLSRAAPTAMVGDGINDAPALAQAEVGISLGSATDIARQSAQAILLQEDLSRLIDLHRLSVNTVKTIRQNLFWAFFYNVLAIPAAALGFLKPILAVATMAISDVIVVGNSLRLRFKK